MNDTQWPRFEVFQQERPDRPHKNVGSVHAPDAEVALQNARDVFVRRPRCHSLWVVPAEAIFARSYQELEEAPPLDEMAGGPEETYLVFQKTNQRNAMVFVEHTGEVQAARPEQALARAIRKYGRKKTYVWWVLPERAIIRSDEEDIPSMFLPAEDKPYKHPQQFRTVSMMKKVKAQAERLRE